MTINSERTLIRELSQDEFADRYGCDRFTATVLASRFRYIVQHMCNGLLNTAFSIILRDWYDFAATLSGPRSQDYPMPAVSNSLPLFLGTMAEAVRNSVEEFGPAELRPGDVLIANDPYRSGNHVNDICYMRPVFHDGNTEPVGFINIRAHMLDLGGVVPAGFSATKRNVYENGLVLSPRLLYRDDKPQKETFDLIFDNARFGELFLADTDSIYQNLLLGERLLTESIDRYGLGAYLGTLEYACDLSAESMASALLSTPDGDYEGEDTIDCDAADDSEEYRVRAKVKVRSGRAEVDLSGSSRQARTSINAGWLDAKTAVGVAMKFLLDSQSAFTSATYRDIDIAMPEGTVVSAVPPDGAIFLYWDSSGPLLLALFKALSEALGEDAVGGDYGSLSIHTANGVSPDGQPWVNMAQCGGEHGPWGATKAGDGENYMVLYLANNMDPATEAIETDTPGLVMRKEYVTDSAGPGHNRGGAAVAKDTLWMSEVEHYTNPLHFKTPSGFGVCGAKSGATGGVWMWEPEAFDVVKQQQVIGLTKEDYEKSTPVAGMLDPVTKQIDRDGEYFYFARVPKWETKPHTSFRYITNGGGGWGDPLYREPERVMKDVRDEYVSIEGARRDYGVVIEGDPRLYPEDLTVDMNATEQLRTKMRNESESGN